MGAASAIYRRDVNVVLTLKKLVIWTSEDPFGTTNSYDQLSKYRNYNLTNRASEPRDTAHLLSYAPGQGGLSYLGGLCNSTYGFGVSNLDADAVFPVGNYHWDVFVISHELGHQFGSAHSHCYNPPLDCCYNEPQGCNMCPVTAPEDGSLMSYCHLYGRASLYFHPRSVAVMRAKAEQSTCLSLSLIHI